MIGGLPGITPATIAGSRDASPAPATGAAQAADPAGSFASLLAQAAERTVDTLQAAEQVSGQALQGQADMRQVVDAVMSAEQSLQAAIAIRDKIVTAYLEISRMAI